MCPAVAASRFPVPQHRWLAAEFVRGPDIAVDVRCVGVGGRQREYEQPRGPAGGYTALLLNSTFVFAPGGGGPHSYRFAEVLAAGAVPVTTADLLLPFEPEVSWDECVVRVAEARRHMR